MSFTTIEQAKRQADERKKKQNPPASEQSLRDYFAAKAMQGILAGAHPIVKETEPLPTVARVAYAQADAMLRAREAS
jgi:hypothetical protein